LCEIFIIQQKKNMMKFYPSRFLMKMSFITIKISFICIFKLKIIINYPFHHQHHTLCYLSHTLINTILIVKISLIRMWITSFSMIKSFISFTHIQNFQHRLHFPLLEKPFFSSRIQETLKILSSMDFFSIVKQHSMFKMCWTTQTI
jgi:hypothetical protein